ncbi:MAG: response regulator [Pseudomonadota bacterium]
MPLTVLAVDDSRTMREMIRIALAGEGFEVHVAEDGIHGLEVLGAIDPNVIITDINMPNLDGFGFIDGVRQSGGPHRAKPILVLTTESAPELKARAKRAGATGWIVKPFEKTKLVSAIRRVAR